MKRQVQKQENKLMFARLISEGVRKAGAYRSTKLSVRYGPISPQALEAAGFWLDKVRRGVIERGDVPGDMRGDSTGCPARG